jgi:hypothetical protein
MKRHPEPPAVIVVSDSDQEDCGSQSDSSIVSLVSSIASILRALLKPRALHAPLHPDVANPSLCHAIVVSLPLPIQEYVNAQPEANYMKSS